MELLKDLRVLDLSHAMAGPMCSMFLGAMGAEILKIEPPWGEMSRFYPPLINQTSPYFAYLNRQKKGITLNLKTEKGKSIFKDLVKISDVILENYSPGTMKRLGLNYEILKKVNPKIIYASISGYGQYGPWSERLSFNPIAQAASGYMELINNFMDLDGPKVAPEAVANTIPALFCMSGILSALYYREKTGIGQMIDIAQLDSMISVFPSVVYYTMCGIFWGKSVKNRTILGGTYKCKDGYIQCTVPLGRLHDRFIEVLQKEIDENHIDQEVVEEWMKNKTVNEVIDYLVNAKVPVAPVLSLPDVLKNSQVLSREMIVEIEHPLVGTIKSPGFPIKFSETQGKFDVSSPLLGQHNLDIFTKLLEYSYEEIEELRKEGVI